MADNNSRHTLPFFPPPVHGLAEARYIAPEDMRVGYPPSCTQIDENAKKGLDFLNAMTPKEAEKSMGEWIAVAGGGLVAHGEDTEQVCQEGRKAGKGALHIRYIYATPEEVPWLYVPK